VWERIREPEAQDEHRYSQDRANANVDQMTASLERLGIDQVRLGLSSVIVIDHRGVISGAFYGGDKSSSRW
jgi:hypothetical protein